MKEELISLETAKLAKEKGFNENNLHPLSHRIFQWSDEDQKEFMFVTQSLLQKWLRDEKGYYITISTVDGNNWMAAYNSKLNTSYTLLLGQWSAYEEALEQGLIKALELIK